MNLIVLLLFITVVLIVISLNMVMNVLLLPHLNNKANQHKSDFPLVSVMIPARDEAVGIAKTIEHLLAQSYPHFEVILLDDNSSDGTAETAQAAARGSQKLKIVFGQALPDGWMGKNWACHQMVQIAQGEILIFTDADVIWQEDALSAVIQSMQRSQADLFTVWPTQETITWGERLCVPLMAFVILGYLPIVGTHYLPVSAFGAANGQCMVWRRSAYHQIGGHQAVADNVLEDVTMAKMVKSAGLRLRMADGNSLISCRMYSSWQRVRDGFAKNILAGYGTPAALMFGIVFHLTVFILPWVLLFTSEWGFWSVFLILIAILLRMVSAVFTDQRILDALFMPISVLLMTRIALQALWWHYRYGGPCWKGRIIHKQAKTG